ncbi:MAG: glycoside hydrolase domain-containing protein [Marmoricola sp.]
MTLFHHQLLPARPRLARRRVRLLGLLGALTAASVALVSTLGGASAGATAGPLSPGAFTGMGFDACAAPSQRTMDTWMKASENPYRAVGVYISGVLRACSQPNLTASWVSHVTSTGWHVLPIDVGPQASCSGFSSRIDPDPTRIYAAARRQGVAEATSAAAVAGALGIPAGSTLFDDMESWHIGYTDCDASTLWFLSAWTNRLHALGYAGGVYSSASTGVTLLNRIADDLPAGFVLPDQLWFAQWNNQETVASSYVTSTHWADHQRVHQFLGGHKATNGGVSLNIDSNWLDVRPVIVPAPVGGPVAAAGTTPPPTTTVTPAPTDPPTSTPTTTPTTTPPTPPAPTPSSPPATVTPTPKSSPKPSPSATPTPTATAVPPTTAVTAPKPEAAPVSCSPTALTRTDYPPTSATTHRELVGVAQCLLHRQGFYRPRPTGVWDSSTTTALRRFEAHTGLRRSSTVSRSAWTALLSAGTRGATLRIGATRPHRDLVALARALDAAIGAHLHATGYFGPLTKRAVRHYQRRVLGHATGVVGPATWRALHHGRIPAAVPQRSGRVIAPTDTAPAQPGRTQPAAPAAPSTSTHVDGSTGPGTDSASGIQAPVRAPAPVRPEPERQRTPVLVPRSAATPAPSASSTPASADAPVPAAHLAVGSAASQAVLARAVADLTTAFEGVGKDLDGLRLLLWTRRD